MSNKKIARELMKVAKEIIGTNIKSIVDEYIEVILHKLHNDKKENYEKALDDDPQQIINSVSKVLNWLDEDPTNPNFRKMEKYFPDRYKHKEGEFSQWWNNLPKTNQDKIIKKIMIKTYNINF